MFADPATGPVHSRPNALGSRSDIVPVCGLNQGRSEPYGSPGTCIGIGISPVKTFIPACTSRLGIGSTTPHSQLRQRSFGAFVVLSLLRRPLQHRRPRVNPAHLQFRVRVNVGLTRHSQRGWHCPHMPKLADRRALYRLSLGERRSSDGVTVSTLEETRIPMRGVTLLCMSIPSR